MPEFKEKPKMGLPKSKRSAMLDPRHRAVLLKEKYRQQMEQRQDTGAENAETQAVSRVESAAEWAADELRERVPQAPKKKPPVKERPSTYDEAGHETESPSERREKTPAERAAQNGTGTEQAVDHRVPTEKQQLEARRQFVVDKQEKKWRAERQAPPSAADPLAVYEADWEPVSPPRSEVQSKSPFKERRPRSLQRYGGKSKTEKPPNAPKVRRTFSKAAKPVPSAVKPSQQALQQRIVQTKKTAKTAFEAFKRTAVMVRRAAATLISAVTGLIGGTTLLLALAIIIVIAAVASSPFGLFFAAERNAPDTVSVAEAVTQVNIAYNTKLEELQAGNYDSIQIHGQAPDWPEVLAVFAAKTAGADDGVDVATLDADRVSRLTAVFWDMTEITTEVKTIEHSGSGDDDGWTEYILHITITPKTADDMRTAYAFTRYQNDALDELLADRVALASLASSLTITNADAAEVLQNLPDDLSSERRAVVQNALTLYGKVSYFWGGKSLVLGWDSRWGQLRQVTAAGSSTTGTYRPYGLDCSGFVDWAFYNATGGSYIIGHGGGATMQHSYCTDISWQDARPGDLVFYPDNSHVGIICGRDETGNLLVIHCASGANNVVITGTSGFVSVARPEYYGE